MLSPRCATPGRSRPTNAICVSHLSPATRNRQEIPGCLLRERCPLLQRKHQISVALCLRCERSKFPSFYTKSQQSNVRVRFHAFQAQGNLRKSAAVMWRFLFVVESIVSHH
jgi:hypothetical protein